MEACGARISRGARVNALANLRPAAPDPTMEHQLDGLGLGEVFAQLGPAGLGDLLVVLHHLFGEREGRHFARCELRALAVPSERGELRLRKSHSHADGVTDATRRGSRTRAPRAR